jgi:hypothetical protein
MPVGHDTWPESSRSPGFSSEVQTDLQDASSHQLDYYPSGLPGAPHEMTGFRQHRPTSQ